MSLLSRTSVFSLSIQTRSVSGYKMNADNIQRKKLPVNNTDEENFRDKIDHAVMSRRRTRLRGFEKVTSLDILRRSDGPDPNEPFRGKADIPKYRSYQRYFDAAERERKRQREDGVWWKTIYYWLTQHECSRNFTNIGMDLPKYNRREVKSRYQQLEVLRNSLLEKQARERTLILDVESVSDEWERSSIGQHYIKTIIHHYNIFEDLFLNKDFYSTVPMNIGYQRQEDIIDPVYHGNELLPSEVGRQPLVHYEPVKGKLYTILLTNPDEHLEDNEKEYIHWLIGNIPGKDISQGEVLVDYMPPFPSRGTGYQRMVFVLFQHDTEIDFSSEKRQIPCTSLRRRDFKTSEFYESFSQLLTPVSLNFYQCKWDASVQNFFYHVLGMPEPVYEYEKLSRKQRLSILSRHKERKTLKWLSRFLPKEPIYPDESREFQTIKIESAVHASAAEERPEKRHYPVENVY